MNPETQVETPAPRICATCGKNVDGWCLMWSRETDPEATCSYWSTKEDVLPAD